MPRMDSPGQTSPSPARRGGARRVLQFLILFPLLFIVLQRGYLATRHITSDFLNQGLNGVPSAAILNILLPADNVEAIDGQLVSTHGSINIKKGCEGVEVALILVSAILAYPMPWQRRLSGVVAGLIFVYAINLIRITSLYYIMTRHSKWFDAAHVTLWQTIIILLSALFFLGWIDGPKRKKLPR